MKVEIDLEKEYKLKLKDILLIVFLCMGIGSAFGLFLSVMAWILLSLLIFYIILRTFVTVE